MRVSNLIERVSNFFSWSLIYTQDFTFNMGCYFCFRSWWLSSLLFGIGSSTMFFLSPTDNFVKHCKYFIGDPFTIFIYILLCSISFHCNVFVKLCLLHIHSSNCKKNFILSLLTYTHYGSHVLVQSNKKRDYLYWVLKVKHVWKPRVTLPQQ